MVEYNPGAPQAELIVINDDEATITIDGVTFPWAIKSSQVQIGYAASQPPPYVRLAVMADQVIRYPAGGGAPQSYPPIELDPDYDPD